MLSETWRDFHEAALGATRDGRTDDALRLWASAAQLLEGEVGVDAERLMIWGKLARIYGERDDLGKAVHYLQLVLDKGRQVWGPTNPGIAKTLTEIARLRRREGRPEDAAEMLGEALRIWELSMGPKHYEVGTCLVEYAQMLTELGQFAAAEGHLRRALKILEDHLGRRHVEVARAISAMSLVLLMQERYDEAEANFVREFELWREQTKSKRPDMVRSLNDVAMFFIARRNFPKAEQAAKRALALGHRGSNDENVERVRSHNTLGICASHKQEWERAQGHFEKALEVAEKIWGDNHPRTQEIALNVATLTQRIRRQKKAAANAASQESASGMPGPGSGF